MTTQQQQPLANSGAIELSLYRALGAALSPLAHSWLKRRISLGKEEPSRLRERFGYASRERRPGELIWIHAASVGECLAALPLIERLLETGGRNVLLTSGTVTSARLMEERLPAGACHQYVPLDFANGVSRFLDHWRPDVALFVESELWPNLILETQARGVPMALVNARLSEKSFRGWRKSKLAQRMLAAFEIALAQDEGVAQRLTALGARDVRVAGSLKADAPLLPADPLALNAFKASVGTRPLFLAASTHPGEEEIVLDAFADGRDKVPNLLAVIVPRHPQRGSGVATLARERGFNTIQRSANCLPNSETDVYVADTMGELGVFYRAAHFAFLGGSLVPHGGQNPLEPARFGVAVVSGPHTDNFSDIFDTLLKSQREGRVQSRSGLAAIVARLAADPKVAANLGSRARIAAESLSGALARTLDAVEGLCHVRTDART